MKYLLKSIYIIIIVVIYNPTTQAQNCTSQSIQLQSEIASTSQNMTMTMMHDVSGRPYLYVANKEAGLKIYDISTVASPVLKASVPISSYGSMHVMNLSQDGNYIYLALGNSFTSGQSAGMAIVDVTTPSSPTVTDYYTVPNSNTGGGIVKVEGNYAYLGAMGSGLVILDISTKTKIKFVSQFIPDINYPDANPSNKALYNARGMEVKNSIVYLCYDAGGFRIINCTDKSKPIQTGRYSNPVMNGKSRAYNNIAMDDSLVYITVDYCGIEVLNIYDTSKITLTGWWNPYNCPNNNWFTSGVHANEIYIDKVCKQVFTSTGKSDMYVLNVANPAKPDSCNHYGGLNNNLGTWGVSVYKNQIYLSYIIAIIPFSSNWTGVKILTYNPCNTDIADIENIPTNIYPVPASNTIIVEGTSGFAKLNNLKASAINTLGQSVSLDYNMIATDKLNIDISNLKDGIYFLQLYNGTKISTSKFIKVNK